jgi:outer membrane lipoprotein carrier protein
MFKRLLQCGALAVFTLALPLSAHAGAVDALKQFLRETKSFSAEFSLSVRSENNRRTSDSTGKLALQKPGKFRWEVEKPYSQLIVGDGQKVWIYDADLMQVTVKAMDQTLGATPASLLAGSLDVLRNFDFAEAGEADGLAWVEATPKSQEGNFTKVRLGFAPGGGDLKAMELFDNFGQISLVRFHLPKRNSRLPASQFRFTPPEGVEVIGEPEK